MHLRFLRGWLLGFVGLAAMNSGCEPLSPDGLIIATSWPSSDRARIESEFAGWLERYPRPSAGGNVRIDWLILSAGDDLEAVAARRRPPDVLLGGPARSYARLARGKRLAPLPIEGGPPWALARKSAIRLVSRSGGDPDRGIAFDDPRIDPVSLGWAEAQLEDKGFPEGYARLVRDAGDRRRIGRTAGSASAAIGRGEADRAVQLVPADRASAGAGSIPYPEGVAIAADGRHPEHARLFVEFLAETERAGPMPTGERSASSDELGLLADLLGATLVDSQDELWAAWAALGRAGSPAGPLRWMTEPPPWPPASIAKLLEREGEEPMAMVETLAGQLATDPAAHAWLLSNWLSSPRPIDRRVLEELARAAEGRLCREPRFREWLRAEWTAWARQRYRRVQRVVEGGIEPTPLPPTASNHP